MKAYNIYIDGEHEGTIAARSLNDAEMKARQQYPYSVVWVEYTEL